MFILASLIHSVSHGGRGLERLPSIATQRKSLMGTANQCQGERVGLGWNVDEKQGRPEESFTWMLSTWCLSTVPPRKEPESHTAFGRSP